MGWWGTSGGGDDGDTDTRVRYAKREIRRITGRIVVSSPPFSPSFITKRA